MRGESRREERQVMGWKTEMSIEELCEKMKTKVVETIPPYAMQLFDVSVMKNNGNDGNYGVQIVVNYRSAVYVNTERDSPVDQKIMEAELLAEGMEAMFPEQYRRLKEFADTVAAREAKEKL